MVVSPRSSPSANHATLKGKKIYMFVYGSGLASSFYTITVKGDTTEVRGKMVPSERTDW